MIECYNKHMSMKHNEILYQIFPRNYSKEGTFLEIEKDLSRIKNMGVTIIYLMPIHEIGVKARKGSWGSPYAVKDYFSISKDLGSLGEFTSLVNKVHALNMRIIIDMVFNHTSPDNVLLKDHEDYYFHKNGKLGNRVGDWSDIVDLDTQKKETQEYLLSVLKYWVSLGVDGFRFDVASMIDFSFFSYARKELGKDIIFLGESIDHDFSNYLRSQNEIATLDKDMYPVFDSLYNYNFFREMIRYIKGEGSLQKVIDKINEDDTHLRTLCLENHDNDRISSLLDKKRLSNWLDFFSFIKGQIFIYMGEEYGNKHKPELFEKDPVDFSYKDEEIYSLYLHYINRKLHQKEIIKQHISLIDINRVKVTVTYIDNSAEEKEFEL